MTGFAQGFRDGWGLVDNAKNNQLKKDQLEQSVINDDRDYSLAKQAAIDTAAYRKADLGIKQTSANNASALAIQRATNAGVVAGTNSINANIAKTKQDNLADPNSLERQELEATINAKKESTNASKASTEKLEQETKVATSQNLQTEAAIRLSNLWKTAKTADGRASDAFADEVAETYAANKGTMFNLGTILADTTTQGKQEIGVYMEDVRNGLDPIMSNNVKRAFSQSLGLNDSAAIGRQITSDWENAPEWVKKSKSRHMVKSQGLWDVSTGKDGNLNGLLYVLFEDENGDEYPYFPPLTAQRNNTDNKSLDLNLTTVTEVVAAQAHMGNSIKPLLKPMVKQARIREKYGNRTGDNGEDKFQKTVSTILETNRKAHQNGDNTYNLFGMTAEMSSLPPSTQLSETQIAEMKNNIEERLLFGAKVVPDQVRVEAWLESTTAQLKSSPFAPVEELTGKEKRKANGSAPARNLSDLIPEEKWTPQVVSELQGYYNEEGEIDDQEGLTKILSKAGWLD